MKKITELKKTDLEILEEIHKRLSENNKKTKEVIEKLKEEIKNETIRNR